MAKLAGVIDSLEAVPEAARGFYTEQDGKFVLDADVEGHPAVANLKSAHQRQKEATAEAKARLKQYEGLDLEEVARLKEEDAKRKKGGKGKDEDHDVEKIVTKRVEEALAEVKPVLEEAERLRSENRHLKLHGAISKAALEAGVLPEALDDALAAADSHFDLKDNKVLVLDEDGDPTGLTPDKFFAEQFKKRKPWFYAAKQGGGSGTPPHKGSGGGSGTNLSVEEIMKLPAAERMALGRQTMPQRQK